MPDQVDKAVILAAGRGTRMRQPDPAATLTPAQQRAAEAGHKALMPVPRPFLDYQVAALAEAGIRRLCVVIGPHQHALREHVAALSSPQVETRFAVQETPRGTAHAALAAEGFVEADPFLLLNSDNYYPAPLLRRLIGLDRPGLAVLDRARVLAGSLGNLDDGKLAAYAVVERDSHGFLAAMVEKPSPELWRSLPEPVLVSINGWRFSPEILHACREIEPSPRGEYEIQAAALLAMRDRGTRFRVVICAEPVLDLSARRDVAAVQAALAEIESHAEAEPGGDA